MSSAPQGSALLTQWTKTQLHKSPLLFGAARRMLFTLRRAFRPLRVHGLPGRVHPNDFMAHQLLPGAPAAYQAYVEHSKRHFDIISEGLQRAGRSWHDLGSVIDFACGYGRVTRWLPTVMPAGAITAYDIQKEAVEWCAAEFGVHPVVADSNFSRKNLDEYDMLFSISLLSHLSDHKIHAFFSLLSKIIRPSGVVIFSTHGRRSARTARAFKEYLDPGEIMSVLNNNGIAFVPYPHYNTRELGDTFVTKDYIERRISIHAPMFSLVWFQEALLWDIQDCYVFKRAPIIG